MFFPQSLATLLVCVLALEAGNATDAGQTAPLRGSATTPVIAPVPLRAFNHRSNRKVAPIFSTSRKMFPKRTASPPPGPLMSSGNKDPNSAIEFRGYKGQPYKGAFRVPFAVSWRGKIAPGRTSEFLGYFPDVLPTIAEVVGASVPKEVDGISFLPELIGEQATGRPQMQHDYLYWEKGKWVTIRQGDWYAVNTGRKNWELYNMAHDPAQANDVAAASPEVLSKLQALAKAAHEPQRVGTYSTRERADRDRKAH